MPPEQRNQDDDALVVVFETVDATEAEIVKSLFEGAGIPCVVEGEDRYDAFRGAFRGTVFDPLGRPVVFWVPSDVAEVARLLLEESELPEGDDRNP